MKKDALEVALNLQRCKSDLAFMELQATVEGDFELVKSLDKAQKFVGKAILKIEKGVFGDDFNLRDVSEE